MRASTLLRHRRRPRRGRHHLPRRPRPQRPQDRRATYGTVEYRPECSKRRCATWRRRRGRTRAAAPTAARTRLQQHETVRYLRAPAVRVVGRMWQRAAAAPARAACPAPAPACRTHTHNTLYYMHARTPHARTHTRIRAQPARQDVF